MDGSDPPPRERAFAMKRLHVVGKSPDNKRLILATTSRAKSGRFEVSISPKMLKLVEEAGGQGARSRRGRGGAHEAPDASDQAVPDPSQKGRVRGVPPAAFGEDGAEPQE